jgi:hypothetical protein
MSTTIFLLAVGVLTGLVLAARIAVRAAHLDDLPGGPLGS